MAVIALHFDGHNKHQILILKKICKNFLVVSFKNQYLCPAF
jgi:hypothetical protein